MLSRENEEVYRLHLENILQFTGGERILKQSQVCEYTHRKRDWVKSHTGMGREITAENLARKLMQIK